MTNPLPNPLPAGTVVFVPDEKGTDTLWKRNEKFAKYDITSPVHILDEGMVEAVCCLFENPHGLVESSHARRLDAVRAAFAHVLNQPQETGKDKTKTCREEVDDILSRRPLSWDPDARIILQRFADAIDALRAELKEVRNG